MEFLMMKLKIKKLHPDAQLPTYATGNAAGADLYTPISFVLEPGERTCIMTGLHLIVPKDYCVLIIPRSGMAHKLGITVTNSPGLIDPDYPGELGVLLINRGKNTVRFEQHERIAQMLVTRRYAPELSFLEDGEEDQIEATDRVGGFGSTGNA